jgi:hypothetical protein
MISGGGVNLYWTEPVIANIHVLYTVHWPICLYVCVLGSPCLYNCARIASIIKRSCIISSPPLATIKLQYTSTMKRGHGTTPIYLAMEVDMEGDGKDGKDEKDGKDDKDDKDGKDKLGASGGRYNKCEATHQACGVCGHEWTGSHAWWYSNKSSQWLCRKCQAKETGWIDYKGKNGKGDGGKDENTDGGGGGAGDTEMCVS